MHRCVAFEAVSRSSDWHNNAHPSEKRILADDFEGPSPHNANLAGKGIVGLGAYAKLLAMKGDAEGSARYFGVARDYALKWMKFASDPVGSPHHYKLQYAT